MDMFAPKGNPDLNTNPSDSKVHSTELNSPDNKPSKENQLSSSHNVWSTLTMPLFGPYRKIYLEELQKAEQKKEENKQKQQPSNTEREEGLLPTISYVCKMIWETAKSETIWNIINSVVCRSALVFGAYCAAKQFRLLEPVFLEGKLPEKQLFIYIGITAVLGAIGFVNPFMKYVRNKFYNKINIKVDKYFRNAISQREKKNLESNNVSNEMNVISSNKYRVSELADGMLQCAENITNTAISGGYFLFLASHEFGPFRATLMTGTLLMTIVPHLMSEYRHAKDAMRVAENNAEEQKRIDCLSWGITSPDLASELKTLGKEKIIQEQINKKSQELKNETLNVEKRNTPQKTFSEIVGKCAAAGLALNFIVKACVGELAPETLTLITGTLFNYYLSLSSMCSGLGMQIENFTFVNKIKGFITEGEQLERERNKQRTKHLVRKSTPPEIVFKNVSLKYQNKKRFAVNNISFTIKPGECVAFWGPNGCGKTTIRSLIQSVYTPTSGEVLFDGVNIKNVVLDDIANTVTSVGQGSQLFRGMSFRDNIELGSPNIDGNAGTPYEEAKELAGISDYINSLIAKDDTIYGADFKKGVNTSGGEYGKMVLARTHRRNANVVIMDEATAFLDPISEDNEYKKSKSRGSTVIIITHNLGVLPKYADRIFVMDAGEIVAEGTHDELMERCKTYRDAFNKKKENS